MSLQPLLIVQQIVCPALSSTEPPNTTQDITTRHWLDTMAGSRGAETWQRWVRRYDRDAKVRYANEPGKHQPRRTASKEKSKNKCFVGSKAQTLQDEKSQICAQAHCGAQMLVLDEYLRRKSPLLEMKSLAATADTREEWQWCWYIQNENGSTQDGCVLECWCACLPAWEPRVPQTPTPSVLEVSGRGCGRSQPVADDGFKSSVMRTKTWIVAAMS